MQTMGRVRDVLNDHINETMRSAFESLETFECAKEEYDYYYFLFQSTWEYKGIAYKHFLAREISKASETWKLDFLKSLYEFYCPEEFFKPKGTKSEDLISINNDALNFEEEPIRFAESYREVPAPTWVGDLQPAEEVSLRVRMIGE